MNTRTLFRWTLSIVLAAGLLGAIGLMLNPPAQARTTATYNWPGLPPCDTPSLQQCIDRAQPGDTIFIRPGVYTQSVTLPKAVSLIGSGPATTILYAVPNQRVLTVTSDLSSTTVISGLAFRGGKLTGSVCPEACGGGILISDTARPTLQNLALLENNAQEGGGLWATGGSLLKLSNASFISNSANSRGGGLFTSFDAELINSYFERNVSGNGGGGAYISGQAQLTGGRFERNRSLNAGDGGGLYAMGMTARGTVFVGNEASSQSVSGNGGGAAVSSNSSTLENVSFIGNISQQGGGGLYAAMPSLTLNNVSFINNATTGSGGGLQAQNAQVSGGVFDRNVSAGSGGGAFASSGLTLNGAKLTNNAAGSNGGGVYVNGTVRITNTLFISNSANDGGGLYRDVGGDGQIVNSLFVRNQSSELGSGMTLNTDSATTVAHTTIAAAPRNAGMGINLVRGQLSITDTIITGHATGINSAGFTQQGYMLYFDNSIDILGSSNNTGPITTTDPLFANPLIDDYHLRFTSPAINAGIDIGVNFDIDGQPRPIGAAVDIGFDESATSIQQLIDATPNGGTALIPPGIYTESLNLNRPVNLIGAGSSTTIHAAANDRVLTVTGSITPLTQIANLTFTGGSATTGFSRVGGGVLITGTAFPSFNNVRIISNSAELGGGLYVHSGGAILNNSVVENNDASSYGGGVYAAATLHITGTRFFGNRAYDGSALEITGTAQARVVNAVIAGNPAVGAFPSTNASVRFDSSADSVVLHTTFGNATQPLTRALTVNNGVVTVANTIAATYTYGLSWFGGKLTEDYNLFFNMPITASGAISHGGHSLVGKDPLFKDPGKGDYHIKGLSPAVNKGLNVGVRRDIDLDARPLGGGFDIGADEASVAGTTPGPNTGGSFTYTTTQNSTINLNVPPGAVTETVPLYCSLIDTDTVQPPRRFKFAGVVFELDAALDPDNAAPGSINFNVPVTLSVSYTEAELAAAGITDELTLKLHRFEPTLNEWKPIGYRPGETQTLDSVNNLITATLLGFSRFSKGSAEAGFDIFLPLVMRN